MRKLLAAAVLVLSLTGISSAGADCFGSSTFQTCTDASGNTYNVQRFGNTTITNGSNAGTGSTWSETTQTYGNTTFYNGQTNGNSWNMTGQHFGNTSTYSGTNSQGEYFNYMCNAITGCQ